MCFGHFHLWRCKYTRKGTASSFFLFIGREFKIRQSIRDKDNNALWAKRLLVKKDYFLSFLPSPSQTPNGILSTQGDARLLINIETNSQLKHFDVSTFLFFLHWNGLNIPFHSFVLTLLFETRKSISYYAWCSKVKSCLTFTVAFCYCCCFKPIKCK